MRFTVIDLSRLVSSRLSQAPASVRQLGYDRRSRAAVPVARGALLPSLPAYRARPAGKTGLPTILVVQEIFGVHEYIKDVCRRFAKAGYLAIAPELYFRQGDPSKVTSIPDLQRDIVAKVPDAQVLADFDRVAAWAVRNGGSPSRLGITRFCWGGRIAWLYDARNPRVKAAVAGTVVSRDRPRRWRRSIRSTSRACSTAPCSASTAAKTPASRSPR
jgi:carboxymethylenebutenolidase